MNTQDSTQTQIKLTAILTCPHCETEQKVTMPERQQQHYYKCTNEECLADLAPTGDNDCVFCSYADTPCPYKQLNPEEKKSNLHSLI